jgi:ribosomal protein S18 acetylase RimI-like enzyme
VGVEVRLAGTADAEVIGAIYSRAFAHDPVTSWVTPDAERRERLLRRLNGLIARYEGVPRGATHIAEDAGRAVGAAIWQPPGPHPFSWRTVPFSLRAGSALGRDIPRMIAMGRAVYAARPKAAHWYLQLLGVEPDAQGSGVGSALVREQLKKVDAQGLPAYLETTKENLEFYGRLGFEVVGEIVIGDEAPREYSLVRAAVTG